MLELKSGGFQSAADLGAFSFTYAALPVVIFTEALAATLYFTVFSFFYLERGLSPTVVSILIASTALLNAFWGPVISKTVDRSQHKVHLIALLCALCFASLIAQFCIGVTTEPQTSLYAYSAAILAFALAYNPLVSLLTQYVYPLGSSLASTAYSYATKIGAIASVTAGIILFWFFPVVGSGFFIILSACMFLACSILFAVAFKTAQQPETDAHSALASQASEPASRTSTHTLAFLVRHWYIALPIVIIAFTETSFVSNFELIGLTIGATSASFIFLVGAIKGIFAYYFSQLYYSCFSRRGVSNFAILSAIVATCTLSFVLMFARQWVQGSPAYLSQVLLVVAVVGFVASGSWWGIFSLSLVRRVSEPGRYAETAAYFKAPRALVTFAGITLLGLSVDSHLFGPLMLFNAIIVALTFAVTCGELCREKYQRL